MNNIFPTDDPMFKRITQGNKNSEIQGLIHLMKELPGIDAVLGTEYEIRDKNGDIIYTIKKRGLDYEQIKLLLEELPKYEKALEKNSNKGKGLNKSKSK